MKIEKERKRKEMEV